MAVSPETLAAMTRQIVAEVNPRRVLLFGSQARGDARSDSDVDFMIILDGKFGAGNSRRALAGRLYRRLSDYGVSKDLVLVTTREVEDWKDEQNHCIARALKEGRVLYEH